MQFVCSCYVIGFLTGFLTDGLGDPTAFHFVKYDRFGDLTVADGAALSVLAVLSALPSIPLLTIIAKMSQFVVCASSS